MKKLFLPLFIIHYSLFISFSQPAFIKDSLDKYMEREMKRWNVPGMAVAVVQNGKVIAMKGYGIRETGKPEKTDENTLFQIASNTKAFTGTSLALLHFQKRLSLDDKVTKHLPWFKLYDSLATREVTLRDLLCHRIGFQTFQSDILNWNCNLSRKELIVNMRNVKPVHGFRSQYGYCNSAFLTAGEIIPAVTDTSWDDFLKYHFFLPLKMSRTSTDFKSITADKNACKPHTLVDEKLVLLPYANVDALAPAGSINSCVKDLASWLLLWLDSGKFEEKKILPYEVLALATSSQMLVRDMPANSGANFQTYGLGWFLTDYHGKKIVRHDGGADGFVTTTCFIPALNLGIAVLSNTDANSLYAALRTQIIDAYMNLPYQNYSHRFYQSYSANAKKENEEINKLREEVAKKSKPALELKNYAGKYKNEVYGEIEITPVILSLPPIPGTKVGGKKIEMEQLLITFSHHPALTARLEPLGGNDFLCSYSIPTYGIKKINFSVKDGKVKSVTLRVNDFVDMMEYEFVKSPS